MGRCYSLRNYCRKKCDAKERCSLNSDCDLGFSKGQNLLVEMTTEWLGIVIIDPEDMEDSGLRSTREKMLGRNKKRH
jgi:hypothetical protein